MIPPALSGWVLRLALFAAGSAALFATGAYVGWTKRGDKEANKALIAAHKAEAVRRATEDAWQLAHWKFAYAAEEARIEREQKFKADLAGLDDGSVRVRQRFVCPKAPQAPGTPAEPEREESGLLQSDVRFLLSIAAEADQIADERNQCIASYNALRVSQ